MRSSKGNEQNTGTPFVLRDVIRTHKKAIDIDILHCECERSRKI